MTYRVVLVDDVPEIRQILRLILEHAGPFEVVGEGGNGDDAARLAEELQPDVVVMDVEMHGGPSGWDVLPQIRRSSPGTAVVILSGSAADPSRTEGAAMADGVLEKGLAPQELNDALLGILGVAPGSPAAAPAAPAASATSGASRVQAEPFLGNGAASPDAGELLAVLLDVTSDGVVEVTASGEVVSCNRGAERILGKSAPEAVGRSLGDLLGETACSEIETLMTRAVAGERIADVSVGVATPGGAPSAVTISLAPVPKGVVLVVRDPSASRAQRELEGFAAVASHDMAQPLQVAYGYLEMVRSEFAEGMDETAAAWIDAAAGSLERLRVLVQDILAYTRGGNRDVDPRPVAVEEAALSALSALEGVIAARGAEVRLRPPLPTVAAHGEHLTNVIERLVDNAIRFVPDDRAPIVEVFAEECPEEWIVTVADNGDGIAPELSERVFDVFYRGAKSTNRGTGLGLSLSRKLVERMGGRIWVEQTPDALDGARIRFALPKDVT